MGAFSPSAGEVRQRALKAFPSAEITFERDHARATIIDTWPEDVDDSAARRDWGWLPAFDAARTFDEYLLPNIRRRYATAR